MNTSSQHIKKGFALIELMVAIAILAIAFASIFGAVQLSKRALRVAGERGQAAFILEESTEALRHIRDKGWTTRMSNLALGINYCLDFGTNDYGLTNPTSNVVRLHFDEVAGATTFVDSSGSGANGTCSGATCPIAGVASPFGSAVTFDGSNDVVSVMSAIGPPAYTIEAWVKPSDSNISNIRNIIVRWDATSPSGAYSHSLRLSGGKFIHYTNAGGIKTVTGSTTYVPGTWYHVVGTALQSGMMRLYVNGGEEGTPVAIGTLWTGGDRYLIGSQALFALNFLGDIDGVNIFNRQLSADEVRERYAAGPPCRIIDQKFTRSVIFANACRNSTNQDVGSYSYGADGAVCGIGGLVDADTKIATSSISWGSYSESSALYLLNLFQN